ncbi:unnamed protein product [Gulo gulo]|uniref:Uncharacterized protein n=1 Tax=Gulo gulo TaxID=48420 RepID=A0A9X9M919_GULGU|nr:unnamed protein product [Gulo gulo]
MEPGAEVRISEGCGRRAFWREKGKGCPLAGQPLEGEASRLLCETTAFPPGWSYVEVLRESPLLHCPAGLWNDVCLPCTQNHQLQQCGL